MFVIFKYNLEFCGQQFVGVSQSGPHAFPTLINPFD